MSKKRKPRIEYRYYEMPAGSSILALLGEKWTQNYGREIDYLHFHNDLEVGFCYSGKGILTLEEEDCSFSGGMFSVIPKNLPHNTNSDGDSFSSWEYLFIDVDAFLQEFYHDNPLMADRLIRRINRKAHFVRVEEKPEMAAMIRQIMEIMRNRKELYMEEMKGMLLAFLIELARWNKTEDEREEGPLSNSVAISPALDFISEYYDQQIKIEELAQLCQRQIYSLVISQIHRSANQRLDRMNIVIDGVSHVLDFPSIAQFPESAFQILFLDWTDILRHMAVETIAHIRSVRYAPHNAKHFSELLYLQSTKALCRRSVNGIQNLIFFLIHIDLLIDILQNLQRKLSVFGDGLSIIKFLKLI